MAKSVVLNLLNIEITLEMFYKRTAWTQPPEVLISLAWG